MSQTLPNAMSIIIVVAIFAGALILARGATVQTSTFQKKVSEESLAAGLYYSTQALGCLSRNQNALDETKRFVLDRTMLDTVAENRGIASCATYRQIKYGIYVFDLDAPLSHWTFRNYQPLEEDNFVPRYGQVVVIDDGGKIHRAFIGIYLDIPEAKENLSLWMFCGPEADGSAGSFKSIFNRWPVDDGGRGIEDAYSYQKNNCESQNCVKGPGQALATCQPQLYTYSKEVGAACALNYECKSLSCAGGKCADASAPRQLIVGQPCLQNTECGTGLVCAYDKRCRANAAGEWDVAQFKF